jgi:hypothetical protein
MSRRKNFVFQDVRAKPRHWLLDKLGAS